MKLTCRYSNIPYDIPATFGSYSQSVIHPAFELPVKFLFSRAGDWAANRLNEHERKLMFLALLHKTDLVHFKTAAMISDALVQQNMEHVLRITSWILGIRTPKLTLPQFLVSAETREMINVHHWLLTWDEARKDFEEGYKTQSHLAKLRTREYALEKLIKNAQRKVEDYSGLLSTWAFEAAAVPEYLHEEWRKIFLAKGIAIYNLRQPDIAECLEHMEEYLEHGSIYANAVLRHIRLISTKNKQGLGFGLGMLDNEYNDLDLDALSKNPFRIVSDTVEDANREALIASAPTQKPIEGSYPSRVAYLRAKIRWEMAIKAAEYAAEFTQRVETQMEVDEQINNEIEFDNENSGRSSDLDDIEVVQMKENNNDRN